MATSTTSNGLNSSEAALPIAPTSSNPSQELLTRRPYLANAFKHFLIAVHLPAVAGFWGFGHAFIYYKAHIRLCDATRYCEDLLGLPIVLSPLTLAFILVALFTLDHYLSISLAFGQLKPPPLVPQSDGINNPATNLRNSRGNEGKSHRVLTWVLRTFAIISYGLSSLWVLSSLAAVTTAALIFKYDGLFDPNDPRKEQDSQLRIACGLIAGAFDALLAFCLAMPATRMMRAARSVSSTVPARAGGSDGVGQTPSSPTGGEIVHPVQCRALWNRRTTLDKAVLLPLVSLLFSLFLTICTALYSPFDHLRHLGGSAFIWTCLFNALVTWPIALLFHSYRSSGSYPGTAIRAFISLFCLVVASIWLLVSGTYLFLSVGALFCDDRAPLPHNSPCAYVRKSGSWIGLVTCAFGYLQAFILGATATLSWESRDGIRLGGEDVLGVTSVSVEGV